MESIRKWFYRPKRDDTSLLAQFFYADESLNAVACELDSFDGRQEPERCTTLVNQLRHCQDKVLTICNQIMDDLIPESRANRDFRVKFPDDVMQENLAGQLWFGAECLAAGSSIMNREAESSAMRPLAKALTKSLELVRNLLREHALKGHMNLKAQNQLEPSIEKLIESLKIFDRLFADFELCYVGAMVPVKSTKEYEQQELVCVLFSETLQRALERGLLSQSDVDNYEPALMFTIPRLAIVAGLLAPPGGPLCLNSPETISEMFRPFRNLLLKIRELLWTLNNRELYMLEKLLCSNEEPSAAQLAQTTKASCQQDIPDVEEFVHNFYTDYPNCKDFIVDFYTITKNTGTNMDEIANDALQVLNEEAGKIDYLIDRRLQPDCDKRTIDKNSQRDDNDDKTMNTACIQGHSSVNTDIQTNVSRFSNSADYDERGNNAHVTNFSFENSSRSSSVSDASRRVHHQHQDRQLSLLSSNRNDDVQHNEAESLANRRRRRTNLSRQDSRENTISSDVPTSNSMENTSTRAIIEDFTNPDISEILGSQTDSIEIPQTQYLLNQVSHENNVTGETIDIENSLPDMDSQKLISEANKTLSNLLLDGSVNVDSQNNEISEQTDSGICTVISSENTSLYDKSPEEKKTFAAELDNEATIIRHHDDIQENTSYSCSNFDSPKRKNSTLSETSSCVCGTRVTRNIASFDSHMDMSTNQTSCSDDLSKNSTTRISSSFNGTNEEFVGIAYGNGQISVCDSNPSTFQINYSENWETLNLDMDTTRDSSKREFWRELKCKNCPSTSSREITKIGSNIERYAQDRIAARRVKDGKAKKRHQRKFDRRGGKKSHDDGHRSWSSCNVRGNGNGGVRLPTASSESSRSNSTDRCLNPRLTSFGASLHPSQNTRQMPNFGSHSPQRSPRLCHFEPRVGATTSSRNTSRATSSRGQIGKSTNSHNRKLLDHRRSRSEQIARMKRNVIVTEMKNNDSRLDENDPGVEDNSKNVKCDGKSSEDLMNDGLGPRTDKSGLATDSPSPTLNDENFCKHVDKRDNETIKVGKMTVKLAGTTRTTVPRNLELSLTRRTNVASSSSCSSCCGDSSSETSEFQSDCQDDEEIALAMQAAEIANRNQIRAKFRSSEDLVHRLFVCIAGVADQLQTNFASDLRNILKCVFLMNSSQTVETIETKDEISEAPSTPIDTQPPDSPDITEMSENIERQDSLQEDEEEFEETTPTNERSSPVTECGEECVERAPAWVPDNDAPRCMACQAGFTVVRRRHHCRNCGKVFCGRCSSNNVPLPRYGHTKPVRVCNRCFIYQVMPFTVSPVTPAS